MEADRYQRIKEIFQSVLEAPTEKRQELLNERCGSDVDVRADVERLLDSYESGFLETPAGGDLPALSGEKALFDGDKVGHYTIISKIGSGGMGEVYLAEDGRLGRRVAIKLLPESFTADEDRLRRFEQEARTASALNHPNIITIHEFGETEKTAYIASEYIDGETLRARLARGRLSAAEALEIAIQCASALAAAHENGIIHRDIKPENIMLRPDGLVKILDFGLAKQVATEDVRVKQDAPTERHLRTAPGMILGTVQYMSPEQARGHATDARTDIWSLGCVIYEMLAGKAPFRGESTVDLIADIVKEGPAPLSGDSSDVPKPLHNLVMLTLEKARDHRYQTCKQLVIDLRSLKKDIELRLAGDEMLPSNHPGLESAREQWNRRARSVVISGRSFTLIGRQREIAQIQNLVQDPHVRLITLTGVGGTGKTTIAKVVANEIRSSFEGNVVFVELASVSDPNLVISTIAQALDLGETGSKPIFEILKGYLCLNPSLLIVDNFEQVIAAAPLLAELLEHASASKVLVTSRVLLHLSREVELRVSTFEVPDPSAHVSVEELSKYDSVRLFVQRARTADPEFELTEENASAIAEICWSLDGLPLAIELAAARVRVISPAAILDRLESRLDLLTGGAKDLPERQQTVRATVDWSYSLLNEKEQTIFRRLAVFEGGFTVRSAETVVGPLGDKTIDGIASLLNASLIVKMSGLDDEPRFRMLEVVREYALGLFEVSCEADGVRRRHASFFLSMVEEAEEHLRASQSSEWLDRLEIENDNLRAVLLWSLKNDTGIATRLTAKIPMFWIQRGYLTEGKRWLESSMTAAGADSDPSLRFRQLMGSGVLSKFEGDLTAAENSFEEALKIGIVTDDAEQIAWSKRQLGSVAAAKGEFEIAQQCLEESLVINRQLGPSPHLAFTLCEVGSFYHAKNDLTVAQRLLEEALAIVTDVGNKAWEGLVCWELGTIEYRTRNIGTAHDYYSRSMEIARHLGFKSSISDNLDGFAAVHSFKGDLERSVQLASAAEQLRNSIGLATTARDRVFPCEYVSDIRSALPEKEFSRLWEKGGKLSLEDAIELALDRSPE